MAEYYCGTHPPRDPCQSCILGLRAALARVTEERDRLQNGLNRTAAKLFASEAETARLRERVEKAQYELRCWREFGNAEYAKRSEQMDHAWFCPECGLRDALNRGIDTDGTCSSCGASCCTWDQLNAHLTHIGWHIVTDAEKRVLEAMAVLPVSLVHRMVDTVNGAKSKEARELFEAELSRRTP